MSFHFIYNGKLSNELGLEIKDISRDILPPIQNNLLSIPNKDGAHLLRSDLGVRKISFTVYLTGTNEETIQEKIRTIASWLNPSQGLKDLIISDEPNKQFKAILDGSTSLTEFIKFRETIITFLIPNPYSESTDTKINPLSYADFSRNSIANYLDKSIFRLVEDVAINTPRYLPSNFKNKRTGEETKGILTEGMTENLLTDTQSTGEDTTELSGLENFGSTVNQIVQGTKAVVSTNSTTTLKTLGIDTSPIKATIEPNIDYCFSVYTQVNGATLNGRMEITWIDSSGIEISSTIKDIQVTGEDGKRYFITGKSPSNAVSCYVSIFVFEASQYYSLWWDAAQLEKGTTPSEWIKGKTIRNREIVTVEKSAINTEKGTIEMIYSNTSNPDFYGGLFDIGRYQERRMALFHGPSFTNGLKRFQFTLENNLSSGVDKISSVTIDLPSETILNQDYYISTSWNLTGNVSTGYIKLSIYDKTNDIKYSNIVYTDLSKLDLSSYSSLYLMSLNLSNSNQNGILKDFKLSEVALTDEEISLSIENVKNNYLLEYTPKKTIGKINFNENLLTSFASGGTYKSFPIIKIKSSGSFSNLTLTHLNSGQFIEILDDFINGDIIEIDFEIRQIRKNGNNLMNKLSLSSDFFLFDNLQENELKINDIHLKPISISIEYKERYL